MLSVLPATLPRPDIEQWVVCASMAFPLSMVTFQCDVESQACTVARLPDVKMDLVTHAFDMVQQVILPRDQLCTFTTKSL